MNDVEKRGRIVGFLNNKETAEAVYHVLLSTFLKKRERSDVYSLASERLSINLLQEAWKEMENMRAQEDKKTVEEVQIGM